jgi:hypothetical protein
VKPAGISGIKRRNNKEKIIMILQRTVRKRKLLTGIEE